MVDEVRLQMMAGEPYRPSLGIFGVLRESVGILAKNGKLMASVILLALTPFCLLAIVNNLALSPIMADLVFKSLLLHKVDPNGPLVRQTLEGILNDIHHLLRVEAIFVMALSFFTLFSLIAMVYSSAMVHTNKHLTIKELLSVLGKSWKRPVITWFWVSLFSFTYAIVIIVLILLVGVASSDPDIMMFLRALVILLALLLFVYFTAVCMLGLVISVLEQDCYGMKALVKAEELIKGRKLQGFALMFLLAVLAMAIPVMFSFGISKIKLTTTGRLVAGVFMLCSVFLVKLFIFVVYTVFYYECRKSNEEEDEKDIGVMYTVVSIDEV